MSFYMGTTQVASENTAMEISKLLSRAGAVQIDLGPVWPKPTPSTCAHNFEEIELGGLGKIKRCRHCGTAREVKQEVKRRRFKVSEIHSPGKFGEYLKAGDLLVLEEVVE